MSLNKNNLGIAFMVACTAALAIVSGCSPSETKTDGASPAGKVETAAAGGGDVEGGKTVYSTSCARCHGNVGAPGKAPDLSHFGSDPKHTAQWIAEYVKNPKSKESDSTMPPFEGKLPEDKIQAVAAYVASLK